MLEIRRAERRDAEAAFDIRLQAIRTQCGSAYSAAQVMAWSSVPLTDHYRAWVAEDYYLGRVDGQPVATGVIDLRSGQMEAIFVLPAFMGQGIGPQMIVHLEALARAAGLSETHLEATLNAQDFYRRCGYAGEVQAIYHSPSGLQLACVPMRKSL
ncbi:MAG: hypothetical protein GAK43_01317 [Stenotrophomonas maltophilia]|nr:MAG: hypothetical protein GAK43_01317 [Stenotrophomonas maltophilia]